MGFRHSPSLGICALAACAAIATPPARAAENLVVNGSMEFTSAAAPTGWTFLNPAGESWKSFGNHPSPDGGSYLGIQDLDSFAPRVNAGGITQLVSGLEVGQNYVLSFYSMTNHTSVDPAARQDWRVTFGTETLTGRQTFADAAQTWVQSTLSFTASSAVQALTFVAEYLPGSYPEMLNLDGIVLNAAPVPEPSLPWMLSTGLLAVGAAVMRRRRGRG